MPRGPKDEKVAADTTGKPLLPSRREQLLAQAKLAERFEPVAQRVTVNKLIFESVLSGACTSVEILEAAYGDPQGHRYWELWLSEPLPIHQFAELLALDSKATEGAVALDRYLFQIYERLGAAAKAGETWLIGDTSLLISETWSSLALRNSALAVRPREAIAWMCQNPNARHLVPATPAEIAGSIVSINSPSPVSALPVVVPVGSTGLPAHMARRGSRNPPRRMQLWMQRSTLKAILFRGPDPPWPMYGGEDEGRLSSNRRRKR